MIDLVVVKLLRAYYIRLIVAYVFQVAVECHPRCSEECNNTDEFDNNSQWSFAVEGITVDAVQKLEGFLRTATLALW